MSLQHEIISFLFFGGIWKDSVIVKKDMNYGYENKAKAVIEAQRLGGLRQFIVFHLTSGWGYTGVNTGYADLLESDGHIFPGVEPISWCEYDLDRNNCRLFPPKEPEPESKKQHRKPKKRTFLNIDDL